MLDSVLHAQGIYDCEQKQEKKMFYPHGVNVQTAEERITKK